MYCKLLCIAIVILILLLFCLVQLAILRMSSCVSSVCIESLVQARSTALIVSSARRPSWLIKTRTSISYALLIQGWLATSMPIGSTAPSTSRPTRFFPACIALRSSMLNPNKIVSLTYSSRTRQTLSQSKRKSSKQLINKKTKF